MRCKICGERLICHEDGNTECPVCDECDYTVASSGCAAFTFPELDITEDDLEVVANILYDKLYNKI